MAIILDGTNEMGLSGFPIFPLDFSILSLRFFYKTNEILWPRIQMFIIRKLYAVTINRIRNSVVLQKSGLAFTFWRFLSEYYSLKREFYNNKGLWGTLSEFEKKNDSNDLKIFGPRKAKVWSQRSLQLMSLLKSSGKSYIHLLQPSQYNVGAKKMNKKELDVAISKDMATREKHRLNAELLSLEHQLQLSNNQFNSFNLKDVFKSIEEPVYTDDFCHVNDLGNSHITGFIFDKINKQSLIH